MTRARGFFLAALVGCGDAGQSAKPAPAAIAAVSSRQSDSLLTLQALPAAARSALRVQAPSFVPYDVATVPPTFAALATRSADEGLVIVRGDFEGLGRTDFAIAGNDATGLRVVALFANADSGYRVADIIAEPQEADTVRGSPNAVVSRVAREGPGAKGFDVVVWHAYAGPRGHPEVWRWVPARKRFLLVEPAD